MVNTSVSGTVFLAHVLCNIPLVLTMSWVHFLVCKVFSVFILS